MSEPPSDAPRTVRLDDTERFCPKCLRLVSKREHTQKVCIQGRRQQVRALHRDKQIDGETEKTLLGLL